MASTTHPTKEQVRDWMRSRQDERAAPPTPADIKRQLGWGMLHERERQQNECPRGNILKLYLI